MPIKVFHFGMHARALKMPNVSNASKRDLDTECAVSKFERGQFWYTACVLQVFLEMRFSLVERIRLVNRLLCLEDRRFARPPHHLETGASIRTFAQPTPLLGVLSISFPWNTFRFVTGISLNFYGLSPPVFNLAVRQFSADVHRRKRSHSHRPCHGEWGRSSKQHGGQTKDVLCLVLIGKETGTSYSRMRLHSCYDTARKIGNQHSLMAVTAFSSNGPLVNSTFPSESTEVVLFFGPARVSYSTFHAHTYMWSGLSPLQ